MFSLLAMQDRKSPFRNVRANAGFTGGWPETVVNFSLSQSLSRAPVRKHVLLKLLSWKNGSTPGVVSALTYGGTAYSLVTQQAPSANGVGMSVWKRQLTATEIANLSIAGTGSISFTASVFGVRYLVLVVDDLEVGDVFETKLLTSGTSVNSVEVTMDHVPPKGFLAAFCAWNNGETGYSVDFPLTSSGVSAAPDGSMTGTWGICDRHVPGFPRTARFTKTGSASRMAIAAVALR